MGADGVKATDLAKLSSGSGKAGASSLCGEDAMYSDGAPKAAAAAATVPAATGGVAGFSAEEVAKHTSKNDCWVILDGQVLDVTNFLGDHPGGELAILTFAGKDATEEFNMIHPPDVVGKYAPNAIIGVVGTAPSVQVESSAAPPPALPRRQDQ